MHLLPDEPFGVAASRVTSGQTGTPFFLLASIRFLKDSVHIENIVEIDRSAKNMVDSVNLRKQPAVTSKSK